MNKYAGALRCSWKLFWDGGMWISGLGGFVLGVMLGGLISWRILPWSAVALMAVFIAILTVFISLTPLWLTLMQPPLLWFETQLRKLPFWTT